MARKFGLHFSPEVERKVSLDFGRKKLVSICRNPSGSAQPRFWSGEPSLFCKGFLGGFWGHASRQTIRKQGAKAALLCRAIRATQKILGPNEVCFLFEMKLLVLSPSRFRNFSQSGFSNLLPFMKLHRWTHSPSSESPPIARYSGVEQTECFTKLMVVE